MRAICVRFPTLGVKIEWEMTRVFSGIQPSGSAHLGNYLGALRNWVNDQHHSDSFYSIVDLHAITVEQDPQTLKRSTLELGAILFAIGIDPDVATLFVQSHVSEHAQLAWIMQCVATYAELGHMTQFKDKGKGTSSVKAGLFTYPALMAADILLYDTDKVPVGDDQRQHLELARTLAHRFNTNYGEVFKLPEAAIPRLGARVMDLQDPTTKMSKSTVTQSGIIYLLEPPTDISKKISRAVTDSIGSVTYEPKEKGREGLSNLLEIFSALSGEAPEAIATRYTRYGDLKADLTQTLLETLLPIQQRYQELMSDKGELSRLLAKGAEKARSVASKKLSAAMDAVGFLQV